MKSDNQERRYCVYIHTSPSGKKYVGQTGLKPEYRWGKCGAGYLHIDKKTGKYQQPAFARAILKYGWDSFDHEIIADNLSKEEADNFEKLFIEKLDTMNPKYGYNCTEGGVNGSLSNNTKVKISKSLRGENHPMYGKRHDESTKKKISDSHKGKTISEETRNKLSEARKGEKNGMYGKHHTEESRIKMSENSKGIHTGADNWRAMKAKQYDLQGNFIKMWDCMSDAERELKISQGCIYKCCINKYKTAGGFIWRYYEDELTKEHIDWCNERKNEKRVVQYSLSGEFICVFKSIAEAALKTGVYRPNIYKCCRGKRNKAGGFIWKYYDDIEEVA